MNTGNQKFWMFVSHVMILIHPCDKFFPLVTDIAFICTNICLMGWLPNDMAHRQVFSNNRQVFAAETSEIRNHSL